MTAASQPGVPVRRLQLEADVQLVIEPQADATGRLGLHIYLARRSASDVSADGYKDTPAGFRVPLHRATDLAESIEHVATRAAQAAALAPL